MKRLEVNRKDVKKWVIEWLLMTLGTALVAVGVYWFKFPNHFSTGGVTGLGVVLGAVIPNLTPGTIVSIINLLFLVVGFAVLHASFGVKTAYCSILLSGLLQLFEVVVPLDKPLTQEPFLELFFAVVLPSLGSAILFNLGASTGGTDIAAMIMHKFTALNTGTALLLSDVLIAAATLLVFDVTTGLFSLLGLVLKSLVVDSVIESLNRKKSFTVITTQPQAVIDYITHTLGRGATMWQGKGVYTNADQWVILTALSRSQAVFLRRKVKELDPHAFLLITNSSEIFGKGFLRA